MDSRWLGVIVLIIIVILGGWYILSRPVPNMPAPTTETATTTSESASSTAMTPVTVTLTDQGFSPASVTVMQGQAVTFVNQSSQPMWIASNPHPTHTAYDGTDRTTHCAAGYTGVAPFDECTQAAPGSSWSFTFDKAGSWGYHDHLDHSLTGTVVVTAAPAMPSTGEKGGDTGSASTSTSVNVQVQ